MTLQQNIWSAILDWENLLLAYRKARRGKRNQTEIQRFGFDLEYELSDIREQLRQKTYRPGGFRQFQPRFSIRVGMGCGCSGKAV